jgi:DNA-binding PucR family transcriptional regulator
VRYRLRQLEALFGVQLHDPDARFELESALRAVRVIRRGPELDDSEE